MDLLAVGLIAVIVTLLFRAAALELFDVMSAFGSFFIGWRGDGWPRGVQEEDRDRPWGRARAADPTDDDDQPDIRPKLTRLHPVVGRR